MLIKPDTIYHYPVWHFTGRSAPDEPGMTQHSYYRHHIPTGQKQTGHVWVKSLADLYRLMNHWNSQSDSWKYYA